MTQERLASAGPWTIENERAIAPDDTERFNLKYMAHNGRKRFFSEHLPLDEAQVTNRDTGNAIRVTFNQQFPATVMPNASEPFEDAGITAISITNLGDTTIDAGNVIVELAKDAYDADDQARREAGRGGVSQVVEKFTGLRL